MRLKYGRLVACSSVLNRTTVSSISNSSRIVSCVSTVSCSTTFLTLTSSRTNVLWMSESLRRSCALRLRQSLHYQEHCPAICWVTLSITTRSFSSGTETRAVSVSTRLPIATSPVLTRVLLAISRSWYNLKVWSSWAFRSKTHLARVCVSRL